MITTRITLISAQVVIAAACLQAAADRAPLVGSSRTVAVRGELEAVDLDRIDGISIRDGRLVLQGSATSVSVDLPPAADPSKPTRGWALVTESAGGDKRTVSFTHETTLEDFSLDLPASDARFYYGGLTGANGDDVLVFAWGADSRSYWGYVTIGRRSSARGGRENSPTAQ